MNYKLLLGLLICTAHTAFADVRLPAILSDNMVLQQNDSAKLWGWAEPQEKIYITTSWDHHTDSTTTTRDSKWLLKVHTPAAGGPYTIRIQGYNTIELKNVLIGEVWVCSGQSNMEMSGAWGLPDIQNELPTCADNNIRFFHIPKTTSSYPQDDCKAAWVACDSNQLKTFSAVGYFFGKKLRQHLHVPIALIEAAWGGTGAEVWTPEALVDADTVLKNAASRLWLSPSWPRQPGYCYNGMITPLTPFNIAGVIWYQGESNTWAAGTYTKLFSIMIDSWRSAWEKQLPFYYVQIAPFHYGGPENAPLLREQQAALTKPGTGMVVISDLVSDTMDIHPKDKHDVGYRLAGWALANTYHQNNITCKSPSYQRLDIDKDKAIVHIADAPGGLTTKGSGVHGLWLAGEDHVFYPAEARIDNDQLIITCRQVKHPIAVRYQYSNAGIGNVSSKQGLPLAPFRTDDW